MQPLDTPPPPAEAVIDTNVLLDWLVFDDAAVAPLAEALRTGALHWVATEAMLNELRHVLNRPPLAMRRPAALEETIASNCREVVSPPEFRHPLICTDPDDQKFIDLALHRRTRWLISRDRAVLKLSRRAQRVGVHVCQPGSWLAAWKAAMDLRTSP